MERRNFLKLTLAVTGSLLMPQYIYATKVDLTKITFSSEQFDANRQTIIVFLAGGPSALSGNLSNLDEINASSQQDYSTFGSSYLTNIEGYDLWQQAGGEYMKNMLDNNDMTLFRTCYSESREAVGNRAHGLCTQQNQRGNYDVDNAGMLTSLSRVMDSAGKFNSLNLPFMTLDGENNFYAGDPTNALKPVSINYNLSNPFSRTTTSSVFYTTEERAVTGYNETASAIDTIFDNKAKNYNAIDAMNSFLNNRKSIEDQISTVKEARKGQVDGADVNDVNLSTYGYTTNDRFHQTLATAVELLDANTNTRSITLGTGGLGGWDDHSYCRVNYTRRMQNLFKALEASMRHLEGIGKKNKVSILVFGEFGRNVNLNNSLGWDHGNLQSLYVLGGTDYFNHAGGESAIIGETVVDNGGKAKSGRIWLKPKEGSYVCDPMSIASTIYAIHGIENPEELTDGFGVINPLINGQEFLTL